MTKIGDEKSEALANDLVWGLTGIGQAIGRDPRQTFYMANAGQIPARKVGGKVVCKPRRVTPAFRYASRRQRGVNDRP